MKLVGAIIGAVIVSASLIKCEEINHPEFVAFNSSSLSESSFFEQFIGDSLEELGWKVSHAKKDELFDYLGEWSLEEPIRYPGYKNDKGLVLKTESTHHAISYKLKHPFNNTDQDLVLQYEVKLQDGLSCGGSYIKLLSEGYEEAGEFNNETPYQIMFGPDVCGSNNKIHLVINRKNPISGKYEEKHLTASPMSPTNAISSLYTLILRKNQQFEIRIDGGVVKAGNLLKPKLFKPEFSPPKEIVNEFDVKPFDWDDQEYIIDKTAKKPIGYDIKHLPLRIPDPDAEKPDDWDETEPEYIVDPKAVKPEDWDDSKEWVAPKILNPVCNIRGCGKWKRPTIPNKDYKGPWIPPRIPNPNYMGEWKPRLIPNPDYYSDETPSNIDLVGGLGFELWSVDKNILFDNIYLGHSIEEAETIGNKTFLPKIELEFRDFEVNKPKPVNGPIAPPPTFDELLEKDYESFSSFDILITFLKEIINRNVNYYRNLVQTTIKAHFESITMYYIEFSTNPMGTAKSDIKKFISYCFGFISFSAIIFGVLNVLVISIFGSDSQLQPSISIESDPPTETQENITEGEVVDLIKNNDPGSSLSTALKSSSSSRRRV